MTPEDVDRILNTLNAVPDGEKGACTLRQEIASAEAYWEPFVRDGHISPTEFLVAKAVALEVAMIVEGGLHALNRAPTGDHPYFGVLAPREEDA